MQRLRFEAFLDSLEDDEREGINSLILDIIDSFPGNEFLEYVEGPSVETITERYEEFICDSSQKSRTFAFWSMYLRMAGKGVTIVTEMPKDSLPHYTMNDFII
jgi:hypothetical protein